MRISHFQSAYSAIFVSLFLSSDVSLDPRFPVVNFWFNKQEKGNASPAFSAIDELLKPKTTETARDEIKDTQLWCKGSLL